MVMNAKGKEKGRIRTKVRADAKGFKRLKWLVVWFSSCLLKSRHSNSIS